MNWLRALAATGPVPVYAAVGPGMTDEVRRLALDPVVELVATPRHASVLLVAGAVPPSADAALRRVHAQLPWPCATLWYRSRPFPELDYPQVIEAPEMLAGALQELHRAVLRGPRGREPVLLPDVPPAPFEGRGDYGQGGEGMMGGTPYGRPMAMTTDDLRDGLALDKLELSLGPFFRGLPSGLVLGLSLQGDVVQRCSVEAPPYPEPPAPPFLQALERPMPIAALELARARHHLGRLAEALDLAGLGAPGRRLLRSAGGLAPGRRLRWLGPLVLGSGLLGCVGTGHGRLTRDQAVGAGGPAARAAGQAMDARTEDPGYRQLGFEPVVQRGGDTRARWRQWLDEIDQSLRLAARAVDTDAHTANSGAVEGPCGRLTRDGNPPDLCPVLESILPGCEWGEALAVIASLPLAGTMMPFPAVTA